MTSIFERWKNRRANTETLATVDVAQSAPPSPLAPIDLTDRAQVAAVMDIAARIGDILLSSGTSNADTKAQIRLVTAAYGLYWCHFDITMNNITLFAQIGTVQKQPVTVFRVVRALTTDFSKLSAVDRLIRSIQQGTTTPEEAEKILDELEPRRGVYGPLTAVFGWGLLGGSVAVMLGGSLTVGAIAFVTCMLIMGVQKLLNWFGLPYFFQNVAGGFIATIPAALVWAFVANHGADMRPSQIVASGIIVLLAGLTLVQSLQDAITGAPVTASAHFFETLLFTGAIIAGVAIGLEAANFLGITMPPLESIGAINNQPWWVRVVAAGLTVAGFAIGSYAEWPAVAVSGLVGAFGGAMFQGMIMYAGFSEVSSASITAVIIGLTGGLLARRFQIPPLITGIAGITPMLPGLSVYRGMYAASSDQMLIGFTNIARALAIASGLAAGLVLGEWIARRIRRPHAFRPYAALRRAGRVTFAQARLTAQLRNIAKRGTETRFVRPRGVKRTGQRRKPGPGSVQ
ncbi:threonine/serine exporter ThrE [Corynebacterium atypicum]|uniref:threonine/serine exporter ThrE n=1 Tax=Corynebacterium atypicum TaxID=191610 RepID=UPI0006917543|nr:threonine/serine exporter family protein [Corynebacterium atypicum]